MRRKVTLITVSAIVLGFAQYGRAATRTWDNDSGDDLWTTASNWSADTAPVAADEVRLDGSDGTGTDYCVLSSATVSINMLKVGYGTTNEQSHLVMQSGALVLTNATGGRVWIPDNSGSTPGNGKFTIQGGTTTVNRAGGTTFFYVGGDYAGNRGELVMSDGLLKVGDGATDSDFRIAHIQSTTGTVTITGGRIEIDDNFEFSGTHLDSSATLNLYGGTIACKDFLAYTNRNPTIRVTDGVLETSGDETSLISSLADEGMLTAPSGGINRPAWTYTGSNGRLRWDYNNVTAGKTTLWAVPAGTAFRLRGEL